MSDAKYIMTYELWNYDDLVASGTVGEIAETLGKTAKEVRNIIRTCDRTTNPKKWKVKRISLPLPRAEIVDTYSRLKVVMGDNVRRLREDAGLSQSELADELGMYQPNLSKIELGFSPSLHSAAKIIDYFKIDPVILFEDWLDQDEKDGFYEL